MRTPGRKQAAAIAGATSVVALASYLLVVAQDLREAASSLGRALDRDAQPAAVGALPPAVPQASAQTAPPIAPPVAPPAAPEHATTYAPPPQVTQLAAEHMPAAFPIRGQGDAALHAQSLETLLADDPDTLQTVRELLRERDPVRRKANLELIRESFGIE